MGCQLKRCTVRSTRGGDDVVGSNDYAGSDDDVDRATNYVTLYTHWLKMVEENFVLSKEKVKLKAQIGEAPIYAPAKEEEGRHARVQLEKNSERFEDA